MFKSQKFLNFLRPHFKEGMRVGIIMGTGDLLAQTLIEQRETTKIDLRRTLKFASVGLLLVGPTLCYWYGVMEAIVPKQNKTLVRGFKKMLLDQFVFAPGFSVVIIGAFSFLNGDKFEDFKKRMRYDYINIMLASYTVWPVIQGFNFTMVPVSLQVPFAQLCGVFWNCYLSLKLNG